MDNQKQQLVEKLKSANNILVTVRTNPTVDSLSACIGLTLLLNKLDKHATAVFSGDIPRTIDFLKPEETLEKNTDSLRDFIIALDKSKADKLRYKVEDKIVKIFITPYRTSLSQNDLDFSQGDFNVDAVVALGVPEQADLDRAVTAHGRILHDAVVVSINNTEGGKLGSINWQETQGSSLSELVTELSRDLGPKLLDEQIATALLTGIVAETERFSNEKTTSITMNLAADLMAAGANQQLVATELESGALPAAAMPPTNEPTPEATADKPARNDGTLEITHGDGTPALKKSDNDSDDGNDEPPATPPPARPPKPSGPSTDQPKGDRKHDDEPSIKNVHGVPEGSEATEAISPDAPKLAPKPAPQPPAENDRAVLPTPSPEPTTPRPDPENLTVDPLSLPPLEPAMPLLNRNQPADVEPEPHKPMPTVMPPAMDNSASTPPTSPFAPSPESPKPAVTPSALPVEPAKLPEPDDIANETLSELEESVHSPHGGAASSNTDIDAARNEVLRALSEAPETPQPIAALNAQPLGVDLHPPQNPPVAAPTSATPAVQVDEEGNLQMPAAPAPTPQPPVNEAAPNPESPADQPLDMPLPPVMNIPPPQTTPPTNSPTQGRDPNAPPPVPPPMMPPFPQR